MVEEGRVRYGSSQSVPARPSEAAVGTASIVLIAGDEPDVLERCLAALVASTFDDVQRVVVANGPSAEQETALLAWETRWREERAGGSTLSVAARETEILWTSQRLGAAEAINAGIRRAAAPIVILLDQAIEAVGDFVSPLVGALDDPSIAVAGAWGFASGDLRRFVAAGRGEVVALDAACLAFRRVDHAARGPIDVRLRAPEHLGTWWSLVLRDEGPERPGRRAVALDLPLVRHGPPVPEPGAGTSPRDRDARRNLYRVIDQFGGRFDLGVQGRPGGV